MLKHLVALSMIAGPLVMPSLERQLERQRYKDPGRIFIIGEDGPSIGSIDRKTGSVFIIHPDRFPSIGSIDKQGNMSIIEGMRMD